MRFNAKKKSDGKWAVFTGGKFFVDSVTDNEQAAKEEAIIRSMIHHQIKQDELWEELQKITNHKRRRGDGDTVRLEMNDNTMVSNRSDVLC